MSGKPRPATQQEVLLHELLGELGELTEGLASFDGKLRPLLEDAERRSAGAIESMTRVAGILEIGVFQTVPIVLKEWEKSIQNAVIAGVYSVQKASHTGAEDLTRSFDAHVAKSNDRLVLRINAVIDHAVEEAHAKASRNVAKPGYSAMVLIAWSVWALAIGMLVGMFFLK